MCRCKYMYIHIYIQMYICTYIHIANGLANDTEGSFASMRGSFTDTPVSLSHTHAHTCRHTQIQIHQSDASLQREWWQRGLHSLSLFHSLSLCRSICLSVCLSLTLSLSLSHTHTHTKNTHTPHRSIIAAERVVPRGSAKSIHTHTHTHTHTHQSEAS